MRSGRRASGHRGGRGAKGRGRVSRKACSNEARGAPADTFTWWCIRQAEVGGGWVLLGCSERATRQRHLSSAHERAAEESVRLTQSSMVCFCVLRVRTEFCSEGVCMFGYGHA